MDYGKYIGSTGTHYISNSGSDERGKLHGGAAGDQTGKEWRLRSWYDRPWSCVLRWMDQAVALKIAELGVAAALNNKIGYDQYQRQSYWKQLEAAGYDPSAIQTACEADCTAGVAANCKAVGFLMGIPALRALAVDSYSGNLRARFKAAGFTVLTDSKYRTSSKYLLPGDILLYEGHHAATNITVGSAVRGVWKPAPVQARAYALGERILKHGCIGDDVAAMQTALIQMGYSCGRWGADGEFGDATEIAVTMFQMANELDVDGEFGPKSYAKLLEFIAAEPPEPKRVLIVGGNCWVRTAPNTDGAKLGVANGGAYYPYQGQTSENGWHLIIYKNQNGWVSGKYSRLEG